MYLLVGPALLIIYRGPLPILRYHIKVDVSLGLGVTLAVVVLVLLFADIVII